MGMCCGIEGVGPISSSGTLVKVDDSGMCCGSEGVGCVISSWTLVKVDVLGMCCGSEGVDASSHVTLVKVDGSAVAVKLSDVSALVAGEGGRQWHVLRQ
ncbi:hypothetical protein CYMTET_47781 [Cymbomonas tetramitiformis]|uniref:Uncharacterized protein n=1 Tax=Cymbomonas tetramitiformis TaxID=36881 RepID=A0AAE0BUX8_9CHLO|nr:hypothetical protein CYMTET_47781 [Cymbomonas tetramitiformis]